MRPAQPILRLVESVPHAANDLESLFRSHARYVAAIALRLLGCDDEVDDVVQEVFIAALRGLGDLRESAAIRGWLATVTVRIARRKLRRRRFRVLVGLDAVPDFGRLVVGPTQHNALRIVRAYHVLERLAVDDRIAWVLRHVEGQSCEAVAAICGCSVATVKRRVARAQAALDREVRE